MKKRVESGTSMNKISSSMSAFLLQSPLKSVGKKLFLIFFICILAMVSVVGFYSYSQSKSIIERKMSSSINETIDQASSKYDLMMKNYEDFSLQFLADNVFTKSIEEYKKATSSSNKFKSITEIQDRLRLSLISRTDIASITLVPMYNNDIVTTGFSPLKWDEVGKLDWMQSIKQADGRTVWLPTKKSGYIGDTNAGTTFGIGRMLTSSTSSNKDYALIIEFRAESLKTLDDITIGETGKVVVVAPDNTLIYNKDDELIGKPWSIPISDYEKTAAAEQSISKTVVSNGENVLVSLRNMQTTGWTVAIEVPVAELTKETQVIFNVTIVSIIIAALVAAAIGVLVIRMIGRPLVLLSNLMKDGAQGDLTVRSRHKGKDEIGQLSASFNLMMEQITGLVRQSNESAAEVLATAEQLLTSSRQTATSAREIAIATEEIANGASSLAVQAEKGSSLTADIGYKVQDVVEASGQMGVSASEVHTATMRGVEYMNELTDKTNAAEQITRLMVEKVDTLKESTTSIRRILEMLDNIAKQTNILSLNATIEAARAGAAGRGFAVVADEVRQLADQSKKSIQVVGSFTDQILSQIDETLSVMAEAHPLFQAQNQSAKDAEVIFNQVQNRMTDFTRQLAGVSESVIKLDQAQSVLSDTMTSVSAVSEESSATSEEVASLSGEQLSVSDNLVKLSERLEQLSDSLRDTLKTFRME